MKHTGFTGIVVILLFALAMSGVTYAAQTAQCTVTGIKGTVVTLDCGDDADKLTAGGAVKVKPLRGKAIEGC